MKSAILYARVSTDEQAERGTSLDSQLDACRHYAASHGLEAIAEFKDDFTGSRLDRPELMKLIELVRRRAADVVITYSSDRWARSTRVVYDLRDMLKEAGVELHYVLGGKVEFTPEGELMDDTFSGFNVYWKSKIIEVTTRGKNKNVQNGKPVWLGYAPYGYRKVGSLSTASLEIDEEKARIVNKKNQLYTTGNGTGTPQSMRAICNMLEQAQVTPPRHKDDAAKMWIPATIRGILTNELYTGVYSYGKTRVINNKRVRQTHNDWLQVNLPELAIIDRTTFDIAQRRRAENQLMSRRHRKYEYLLVGFFFCSMCQYAMGGGYSGKDNHKSFYYCCGTYWHRRERDHCSNMTKTIGTRKADALVWNWLESLWQDPDKFDAGIMGLAERNRAKLEPLQRQLDRLQALIERQDQRAARFMAQLGDIDDPDLIAIAKTQAKEAVTLRDQMKQEAQELEDTINTDIIQPEVVEELRKITTELRERRKVLSVEGKRILMDRLALRVEFRDDETGRWLDVSCGLHPEVIGLRLSGAGPYS